MCVCLCTRVEIDEIFRTRSDRRWGPPSLLYNEYRVFPGGKAAGAWRWPPTPSSAKVKERVELTPIQTFVACFMLNFSFTSNFTCMDEWIECCVCVCLCMRASISICIKACVNVCACVICVWVCMCEYMNVCVYTIHIYAFRLYSGAVFHGSGTFILRSTDEYLAAHFVLNIWCWSTGSCQSLHLNRQQCTSLRCACSLTVFNRPCCHISQSASSHDTEKIIYKCWCLESHSTIPYDNMAT